MKTLEKVKSVLRYVPKSTLAIAMVCSLMTLASECFATITYTVPDGGFDPANVTALGAAALVRWGEFLAVTLIVALAVGLAGMAINYVMGIFHARRAKSHG